MANDDERRRFRGKLQEAAGDEWSEPRAIGLDGPGPFELPLCGRPSILGQGSESHFVLELETAAKSQRVLIPISGPEVVGLKALIDVVYAQYVASMNERKPH